MLKDLLRNKTIMAAASIAAGIFLMIARRSALYTLVRVLGYVLIGIAVAYLLLYLFGKNKNQIQLSYAGGAAVAGALIILLAPTVINLFPILAGIALIAIGIMNLTAARDGIYPTYSKIGPILTIVLGVLVLFHPGAIVNMVVFLVGAALVLNGLSELDLIRRLW